MVSPPEEEEKEPSPRSDRNRVKEIIEGFHEFAPYLPESLCTAFPSVLRIGLLPRIKDFTLGRRLMATVFACLRANGNRGVHVTIPFEDKHTIEFYYRYVKDTDDVSYIAHRVGKVTKPGFKNTLQQGASRISKSGDAVNWPFFNLVS